MNSLIVAIVIIAFLLCIIGFVIALFLIGKLSLKIDALNANQEKFIQFQNEQFKYNNIVAQSFMQIFGQNQQIMHEGKPVVNTLGEA